jgi:uncharacterized membrane protein
MKKFKAFFTAFCVMFLAVCIASVSSVAEARVTITVKNSTNHSLSLAFCWANFDDDSRTGWYVVPAGQTKTYKFDKANYILTAHSFGYYATGGGKV